MEMPLNEIFQSVYVVENDPLKVWTQLIKNFPTGHFDGILEDMFGGNMTELQEKQLAEDVERYQTKCLKEVQRVTERLCQQMRDKDFTLNQKSLEMNQLRDNHVHELKILAEDLRMQYELKLRDQEKQIHIHYAKELQAYRDREEAFRKEKYKHK
jgi:hypothetical protein